MSDKEATSKTHKLYSYRDAETGEKKSVLKLADGVN